MHRFCLFASGTLAVAAAFLVGSTIIAQAAAPRTEKERLDLAIVDSAPWLVCRGSSTASDGALSTIVSWDYRAMKFQTKPNQGSEEGKKSANLSLALLFDDKQTVALRLDIDDGQLQSLVYAPPPDWLGDILRHWPTVAVFRDPMAALVFSISHLRSADGSFVGLLQLTSGAFLEAQDPVAAMIPMTCTVTADDRLKDQLDAARRKWLANDFEPPPPAPPTAPAPPVFDAQPPTEPPH